MTRLNDVRATLAEADDNYTTLMHAGDHPGIDRVGYTAVTMIDVFRRLLDRPDLQVDDLAGMLRAARRDIWPSDAPEPRRIDARVPKPVQAPVIDGLNDWTVVMARFVISKANEN